MRPSTVLLVAALSIAGILPFLGMRDYWSRAEARPPLVARDMLATGRIQPPYLAGEPYLNKPPLFHGLVAASFSLFGESIAAARLPSALAALLAALLTASLAHRIGGRTAGIAAASLLLMSGRFFTQARSSEMETTLAAAVLLAVWGWTVPKSKTAGMAAVAAGSAIAALVKGPVLAILLPSLCLLAQILDGRSFAPLRNPRILLVPAAAAAATAAYYAPLMSDPGFRAMLLERASMANVEHERGPLYYIPQLAAGLLPGLLLWAPFFKQMRSALATPARAHLIAGALGVAVFSLGASKQSHYLLPFYPHFAIFGGVAVAQASARIESIRRAAALLPLLAAAAAALLHATGTVALSSQAAAMAAAAGAISIAVMLLPALVRRVLPPEASLSAAALAILAAMLTGEVVHASAEDRERGFRAAHAALLPDLGGGGIGSLDLHPAVLYRLGEGVRPLGSLEDAERFLEEHPDGRVLLEWDRSEAPFPDRVHLEVRARWLDPGGEGWVLLGRRP